MAILYVDLLPIFAVPPEARPAERQARVRLVHFPPGAVPIGANGLPLTALDSDTTPEFFELLEADTKPGSGRCVLTRYAAARYIDQVSGYDFVRRSTVNRLGTPNA